MKTYIAKAGERFCSIYAKAYGATPNTQDYNSNGYNAFVMANIHLVTKPVFAGGEVINLPDPATPPAPQIKPIWQ